MHLYGIVAAVLAVLPQPPAAPPALEVVRPATASLALHAAPAGPAVAAVGAQTEFGQPLRYAVVERRGNWLGVIAPEVGNGRIGWVEATHVRRARLLRERVDVDLSRRVLRLMRDGAVVLRTTVAVGDRVSPTPVGRFAVTDKFRGSDLGTVYGCCVLVLSGNQPQLPPGWAPGEYRLAIHGGDPRTIGGAVSAGCVHVRDAPLRLLMRRLPLGTPVTIHP
jgi:lipoprotein-anchoring transpeptidase ErfK/SrfK